MDENLEVDGSEMEELDNLCPALLEVLKAAGPWVLTAGKLWPSWRLGASPLLA